MSRRGESTLRTLLAPIQDLLDDEGITDIVVQREYEVGYQTQQKWLWRRVDEFDYRRLDAIGLLAGNFMSKKFDPSHTLCSTFLPDGQRFTLCRAPATDPDVISASIRLPPRPGNQKAVDYGDDADLLEPQQHRASPEDGGLLALYRARRWTEFFELAVSARKTIGAIGAMGSGKTFVIRDLMHKVSPDDRLVTVEDSPEYGPLPIRNRVALYWGAAGLPAEECIEHVLRMAADRVAIQELRGGEAMAFIRLQASGHSGSFTTWHAHPDDPWTPLVIMAKTSQKAVHMADEKIEALLRSYVDIIVYCRRDPETRIFDPPRLIYFRGAQNECVSPLHGE